MCANQKAGGPLSEPTGDFTELLPCPCGETPTTLNIAEGWSFRWRIISGNCCGEWEHECRVPTIGENATEEGQLAACIKAWNDLPRAAR